MGPWIRRRRHRTDFHLRFENGQFGWCWSTGAIMRRNERRSPRSRRRSSARARRCGTGSAWRSATRAPAVARRRMSASGSRRWSGRTASCGRPMRSCARRRLILRRRSRTAARNNDRLHRRSSGGARGRADLQAVADHPFHLLGARGAPTRPCESLGQSAPGRGPSQGDGASSTRTSRSMKCARCGSSWSGRAKSSRAARCDA